MQGTIQRIGILTGGGDAPGLNAVIRAAVRAAEPAGIQCVGLADGFDGLAHPERARSLTWRDIAGIHRLGGTILGTTNRGCPLGAPGPSTQEAEAYARMCVRGCAQLHLQALLVIGGDGTLAIAHALHERGIPVVGVPKTIDNDIAGTDMAFGFESAVAFATDAIDRLHTTADAHHRVMVAEVMGRYAGWIALEAAIAGGADVVLIPEIPFSYDVVAARICERERRGAASTIVVVAEGAYPAGGERAVAAAGASNRLERLGGIGAQAAEEIERRTRRETRYDVLGHLQRGGPPSSVDRVLATRFGAFAIDLVRRGQLGTMVALLGRELAPVPLGSVVGRTRHVPLDDGLVQTARAIGMSFGC